jgi:hypothetical protein
MVCIYIYLGIHLLLLELIPSIAHNSKVPGKVQANPYFGSLHIQSSWVEEQIMSFP